MIKYLYLRRLFIVFTFAFVSMVALVFAQSQLNGQQQETGTTYQLPKAEEQKEQVAEPPVEKVKKLNILTWSGAYQKAQKRAFLNSFPKEKDVEVSVQTHNGSYDSLKTQLSSSSPEADVIDMTYHMVDRACASGLLKKIDLSELNLAGNGQAASEDFIADGIHQCGVASMVWSSVIVYNTRSFKRKRQPKTLKHFFNVKRYRGKRALPKKPEGVMEFALLASGVKPDEVYETLKTKEGIARAFKQLDKIKKHIIWWSEPSEPFKLLKTRKASMVLGYSGRAFSTIAQDKYPFSIIWSGQIYDVNYWAIAKSSQQKKSALQFISYATQPKKLATQAQWFPYGPARLSSYDHIKKHPEAGIALTSFLPTHPSNFKTALRRDQKWWDENKEQLDLQVRFEKWIKGEEYIEEEPEQENQDQVSSDQQTNSTENNKEKP